ncbi:MAG: VWA domain-containing protein [Planctomycetes bacterium]|nr:VWA domain-containing protein [Planctomycetota bacterium]
MDVLHPWALLGLGLIAPAVWLAIATRTAAPRWRRVLATALRVAAVAALVLAVAQARLVRRSDKLCVTVLVDQSKSVDPSQRQQAQQSLRMTLRALEPDRQTAVVDFGGRSVLRQLPSGIRSLPDAQGEFARDFTDIGQAVRLALSIAPPDAANRIVLLTDGNDTVAESTAMAAAAMARQAGVPVDVFVLGGATAGDVRVERLLAEPQVQADQPFTVSAVIHSDRDRTVRLSLTRRGQIVDLSADPGQPDKTVRLKAGANLVPVSVERIGQGGFYDYEVVVDAAGGDPAEANNRSTALVRVMGKPSVLIVDGSPEGRQGANLYEALRGAEVAVRQVGPEGFPASMLEFNYHDCVILSDVPADALGAPQMELARQWVRAGGGLVWIGGERSFGPGGYSHTPIEDIAPVSCDTERYIERASLALAIAIDQSGSMGMPVAGSTTKMDLANNGAAAAIRLLDHRDEAGVVMVDTHYKWITHPAIQTMTPPAQKRLVDDVLANQPGGGGIYCHTALKAALDELARARASSKHIILFADADDSEQQEGCVEMVTDARRHGVTVSVIGLGRDQSGNDSGFLKRVARAGEGRVYFTDDPRKLPTLFVRDVALAARNAFIEPKDGITPALVAVAASGDVDPICRGLGGLPRLRGQVATTLKGRATLLMHGPRPDDPLLAKWQYGLGKTVAWTSDARGKWAGQWVSWEGFSKFWLQVVRWAMRNANLDSPVTGWVQVNGQRGSITADAIDPTGEPMNDLALEALVVSSDPDTPPQQTPLRLVGPGRYEGQFQADRVGAYIVTLVDGAGTPVDATGAVMSYSPEYRVREPDRAALAEMAHISGGRVLTDLNDLFAPTGADVFTYTPIALPLVALAMVLFFSDIVVRRFVLPETVLRWLTPARRRQADPAALGRLRRQRSARKAAEPSPVAVALDAQAARRPAATAEEEDDAAAPAVRRPPAPPAADSSGGGMAARLRAAKQRAQEQIREKGQNGRP